MIWLYIIVGIIFIPPIILHTVLFWDFIFNEFFNRKDKEEIRKMEKEAMKELKKQIDKLKEKK